MPAVFFLSLCHLFSTAIGSLIDSSWQCLFVCAFSSISALLALLLLVLYFMTITSLYGPKSDRSKEDKERFYHDLKVKMQSKIENCIALGNFNEHVESSTNGYEKVHGEHG